MEKFTNYHGAMILFVSLAWTKERKHGMKELLNAKKEDTMAILNFVMKKIPFLWQNYCTVDGVILKNSSLVC